MNSPRQDEAPSGGGESNGENRPSRLGDLQKTITMAQIARAAGVSQGAISSLLNDRDYGIRVSEKTRERVFKVCRDMGYIPNDLRAVVRMYPELGEFCLLISSEYKAGLGNAFVSRVAQAVMQSISDSSHPLTLAYYEKGKDYGENLDDLPYPVRSGVASKFLFCGEVNHTLVQQVLRRGLPAISLGHEAMLPGVISFVPDFTGASRMAIEHLLRLGHTRIAIVSGPFGSNDPRIIELHRGVRQAHEQSGILIEAQNVFYGDLSQRAGVEALEEMLNRPTLPTAAFCLSDAAACGLCAAAYAKGVRVPADLSVIGCGNDESSAMAVPPLTTVHLPVEEIGTAAVQEIERVIRVNAPVESRKRVLPVHLVERGSTAAPRKS